MEVIGRDVGDDPPRPSAPVGDGWAVIVGISDYADKQMSLQFAHRDAIEFHAQLLAGTGGLFAPERVRLLTNGEASQRALTKALRGFLKDAGPDDIVVLYLACHGGPDPSQPLGPLYFLASDTERHDIAGTGVPMDEIDRLLRRLPGRRVVIIADTCHSAGVVGMPGTTRDQTPVAEITKNYLQALGGAGGGVALLTSAEANEVSREGPEWGDGHGVFTHFLLEGMRGAADGADGPRDGVVSVGELFEYVRTRVAAETGNSQHPSLHTAAGARHLPLAVTGTADLDHRVALAEHSLQVGWLLSERGPFIAAAAAAEDASTIARLAGRPPSPLDAIRGRALVAAGEYTAAVAVLDPLAAAPAVDDGPGVEMALAHAVALAETADPRAADALRRFAELAPQHPDAAWSAAWAAWLTRPPAGRVYALLIGVGAYTQPGMRLTAPANDVEDMRAALVDVLGADPDHVRTLIDEEATESRVRDGLADLAARTSDGGLAVVYFGGHAMQQGGVDDPSLLLQDFEGGTGLLTPRQLAVLLDGLPESTVVLLDTHLTEGLRTVLASCPATALVACGPGEMAYEEHIDGRPRGAFTNALVTAWRDLGAAASTDELLAATRTSLADRFQQVPLRLGGDGGDSSRPTPFSWRALWRERRCRRLDLDAPLPKAARLEASGFPSAMWLSGRLRTAAGDGDKAARLLADIADETPAAAFDRIAAFAAGARFAEAGAVIAGHASDAVAGLTDDDRANIAAAIDAAAQAEVSALVVGVEKHRARSLAKAPGARAEAAAFAEALVASGIPRAHVTLLIDEQATHAALTTAVAELAGRAQRGAGLLCLAGVGSSSDGWATFCPYDARHGTAGDLPLRDLASQLGAESGVVTILDCGFDGEIRAQEPAGAGAPRETLNASTIAAVAARLRSPIQVPAVGVATIHLHQRAERLLPMLTSLLPTAVAAGLTYREWVAAVAVGVVSGETVQGAADTVVLTPTVALERLRAVLRTIELGPARAAIDVGRRLLAVKENQGEVAAVERLAVAMAHVAVGDRNAALALLRRALEDLTAAIAAGRPVPRGIEAMIKAHLGRLLAAGDAADLEHAVAHLRDARAADGDDPTIGLHLALAMQAQLERRTMRDVADLYEAYLKAGAPDGRAGDVRARLEAITRG